MNGLLQLIIILMVLGVIVWAMDLIGIPQPFNKVIKVILVLVMAIVTVRFLFTLF